MKLILLFILSCLIFYSCFNSNKVSKASAPEASVQQSKIDFYSLNAKTIDGESISMSQFKGKNIIILNVASKCGYTPQYADWQKFYDANKENFVVLGFPCNQFMGQEPGSAMEIETFCQKNYGVTFPMFDKVDVKGDNKHEIYSWLSSADKNGWCSDVPSWNFCKYVINKEGNLTHFFGSKIKPDSPEFQEVINL